LVTEADVGFRSKLCAFFGLDRSTQYKRHIRAAQDQELAEQIRAVITEHKHYGHRRIATELRIGKNHVRRVMKARGIPPPRRRKRYVKANKGDKPAPANLLKTHEQKQPDGTLTQCDGFVAQYPHHIWAEDFTYFWFHGRFYYLATVIDLYSRQVVGWSLSKRHDTQLIVAAVSKYSAPAILHNDRGSEYLSKRYRTICASLEIACSASAPGAPWQNGFQESFYNNFKLELGDVSKLSDDGQLMEAIAYQLHYYNTKRIHSSLSTNPAAYAARFDRQRNEERLTEVRDKVMLEVGT
jgi:putative transposase